MKKILGLVSVFLILMCGTGYAAEDIAQTFENFGYGILPCTKTVTFTCTSAADGSLVAEEIEASVMRDLKRGGYRLFSVEAYPGATGPKDDSDIVLNNSQGFNILGTAGDNLLDNATDGRAQSTIGANPVLIPITDDLTFDVTGNDVASATFVIIFTFVLMQ